MVVYSAATSKGGDHDGIAIAVGRVRHRRVAGTSIPSIDVARYSSIDRRAIRLALIAGHVVHITVAHVASRLRTYDRIQDALAWVLPLYGLSLITMWFVLVQIGFSLMVWSLQAEPSLLRAFISSGSALSTLGFLTPPDLSGQLLAIPEGAFGLGIVVFFFTFIPGYQTTVKTRELKVAWLYARAGPAPTVLSLMEWLHRSGGTYDATAVWEDWEAWFRLLIETHTLAPVVAAVPSVHREQSWLVAAAAVLDTASFWLSSLDTKDHASATLCYSTGVNALKSIAVQHRKRPNRPAAGLPAEPLNRVSYEVLCRRLSWLELRSRSIRTRPGDILLRCAETTSNCCLNWRRAC